MGELYRLDFASGKSYVGISLTTAERRYASHASKARRGFKQIVYRAWRKHGAPRLVVLAVLHESELLEAESRAIATYRTFNPGGYNMTADGSSPPIVTQETGAKISAALKGRRLSDEHRRRVADGITGRKHTFEARARMSVAQHGKVFSAKTREKMALAKLGTSRSLETRAKMSAAQRARRLGEGCTPRKRAA